MNGWDLFTWLNCVVLAGAALIIFCFFLRDVGGILAGQRRNDERDEEAAQPDRERARDPERELDARAERVRRAR
ncbi:MAG TPA: hypothetical protein VEC18_03895 [Myxococcota bacterium]|nr:hypothetical protein [Myxococcota bacterium]